MTFDKQSNGRRVEVVTTTLDVGAIGSITRQVSISISFCDLTAQ